MKQKECKDCNRVLLLSDYYRNKSMKDGYLNYCKSCFPKRYRTRVDNPMGYPRFRRFSLQAIKEGMKMKKSGYSYRVIEAELGIPMSYMANYISGRASLKELASIPNKQNKEK